MHSKMLAGLAGAALLLACGPDDGSEAAADDNGTEAAARTASPQVNVFVEQPSAGAQLVFVGQDSSVRSGRADAVFVAFSTFSVERDGIPNEFPPADSMAAMLERAGVRGDGLVIVGDPIPAGRAWTALDYLGLGDRAALLDGGHAALGSRAESGVPDTAGSPASLPAASPRAGSAELDVNVRRDMIVEADWVHEHLNDPNVVILDARPPAEFSGETPGDGIQRPGHIPGARNLFWQTLVQSAENPRLRDEAELRRMFEQAGVGEGDIVVTYCRTGGQSSFLYAVARHLGYNVRLYDGSFVDWSRTDYPVER